MNPPDRKYSKDHEWVLLEGSSKGTVGITEFAQDHLGDVVYLDLPKVGTKLAQYDKLGEVESVKAVSDIFSPVSGEITEVNEVLSDNPEVVNDDPYGQGWLVQLAIPDPAELESLLTAEQYEAFLNELPS
ncbi:MAG: glycine cleavage system protein GcvH [Dehalococcoidia bacterium]|nr:glycine cleavage system protein GcvH [Dehalococcoidia bacterium]